MTRARSLLAARAPELTIAALILIGAVRIVSTYTVFNHTVDEPVHIACGIQWWTTGEYCITEQPPLARIASGLGPYLDGLRVDRMDWPEVRGLLYRGPDYFRKLALARLGQLPFFLLAASVVAAWTWRLHGRLAAVLATLLFTMTPAVLGHAGLATTDIAPTATFAATLFALCRWLERPTYGRAAWLGAAAGAAVASKFSVLLFFVPAAACAALLCWFRRRLAARELLSSLLLAAAIAFALNWATYRFDAGRIPDVAAVRDLAAPLDALREVGQRIPVPAPEMFVGIAELYQHNRQGHLAYFWGEERSTGWWYFFPVVLALKTPLPFLVLAGIAAWLLMRRRHLREWECWMPLACAAGVVLVSMPSRINLGVRHVLPVYPLIAISAGWAAATLLRSSGRWVPGVALALLVWQVGASVWAHPDYFPYFNELAGSEPERLRTDSDLDWGQDVARLGRELRELGVSGPLPFLQFGNADPSYHGVRTLEWPRGKRLRGWFAISVGLLAPAEATRRDAQGRPAWEWLRKREPAARVGRSILLYRLPE